MKLNRTYLVLACVLIAVGGSLASGGSASAQSAKQRLKSISRELERTRQRKAELRTQKGQVLDVLKSYQQKIEDKESEVRKIEKQLHLAQQNLTRLDGDRKKLEHNLLSYRDALSGRMRTIYMMGDMSYLDLLFSAGTFNDFVDRVFFVQSVCSRDEKLIGKTQTDQAALADKITQINSKIAEIDTYRQSQRQQLGELTTLKRAKNEDLETIDNDLELATKAEQEMQEQSKYIQEQIRTISRSGSGYRGKWTGAFKAPCPGSITSPFGYRFHPILHYRRMHTGVDIGAGYGTTVKSAGNGKVIQTGWYGGYGNCVIVDHGGGRSTLYGHLSRISCSAGQEVSAGTKIGEVGATGMAKGAHLHFEVRINGTPVDPLSVTSL